MIKLILNDFYSHLHNVLCNGHPIQPDFKGYNYEAHLSADISDNKVIVIRYLDYARMR